MTALLQAPLVGRQPVADPFGHALVRRRGRAGGSRRRDEPVARAAPRQAAGVVVDGTSVRVARAAASRHSRSRAESKSSLAGPRSSSRNQADATASKIGVPTTPADVGSGPNSSSPPLRASLRPYDAEGRAEVWAAEVWADVMADRHEWGLVGESRIRRTPNDDPPNGDPGRCHGSPPVWPVTSSAGQATVATTPSRWSISGRSSRIPPVERRASRSAIRDVAPVPARDPPRASVQPRPATTTSTSECTVGRQPCVDLDPRTGGRRGRLVDQLGDQVPQLDGGGARQRR